MPKAEIVVSEYYPVYDIFMQDNHWSEPEHHQYIEWLDIPQELIDEHERVKQAWRDCQRKIWEVFGDS